MKHVTTPQVFEDLHQMRCERLNASEPDRDLIARSVLVVVAHFAGDVALAERAVAGTVECPPNVPVAVTLERHVRALSARAESATFDGQIIVPMLCDEGLYDDYWRMGNVEQHDAFAHDITDAERDDKVVVAHERARAALEHAQLVERWRRQDARLCTCGNTSGRHGRNGAREGWASLGDSVCRTFRHVEDATVFAVAGRHLEAAARAYVTCHDLHVEETAVAGVVTILRDIRASPGRGKGVNMGEALEAAFTAMSSVA